MGRMIDLPVRPVKTCHGSPLSVSVVGPVEVASPSFPVIHVLDMPVSGTEYQYALPAGTRAFDLKARGNSLIRLSINSSPVSVWFSVDRGSAYGERGLDPGGSYVIRVIADKDSEKLEVISWY